MTDANDMELIREYATRDSETAFAGLVHRHINLVYSVALRFTGNSQDAQDVTQAVFIILAQKAGSLRQRNTLTGWLYETTRFTARQFLRTRTRQLAREQEAYMQSTLNDSNSENIWRQLAPLLEEAMARLSEKERTLVALRFFENKSAAETAALLGIQEWAAHKRAARAMEKLRQFFIKRGIASTTATLAGAISANSVQAAPALLAKAVTATAIAKGATASISTLTLINGALKIMAWTKAKTIVTTIGVAVILTASTTGVVGYKIVQTHRHTGSFSLESDIQPDGKVLSRITAEFINTANSTITPPVAWTMTVPIDIQRLTDDDGKPIRFTQKSAQNGQFEYSSFLNRPVPSGKKFSVKMEGTVDGIGTGLIKSTGEPGVFEVQDDGDMGTGYAVHRTLICRLPPGAVLLDKSPNLNEVINGGRVEMRFDQVLSPPANSAYHFRYRLPAQAK